MNQAIDTCLVSLNNIGRAFCHHAAGAFVQSALLIVLLFALDLLLRKRVRAVFRYCMWLLVLVKLVLPPTLSLPSGIGYWLGDRWPSATSGVLERVSHPTAPEPFERHQPVPEQASDAVPPVRPAVSTIKLDAPIVPATVNLTPITWQAVLFLFWGAGVLTFTALLAQRLRFVRGLVVASAPAGGDLPGVLEECRRQMGVRRPVGLRRLDTLPSPAVCGLLRPTVLMPTSLVEKLSPEGLRAALIHELAHIKRADLWINAVQTFLQVVYFYNPFVWFANAVIRRTCEEAVDETVLVTLGGEAKNYSNTLIDIGEMAFWKADFGLRLIGVAESRKALQGRIKHMLTRPVPQSARIGALGMTTILVVAAVLLPMARAERSNKDASATGPVTGAGATEKAPQGAWYYHVKTGGTGGRPVQSEADPGLSSCWNSIVAAFAAVKSRATPGPWVIQVDDEATYDEAVALTDLQTSATETLTLTKAPWLAGRPTIYPTQPGKRALAINGLWPGVSTSEPLADQPGQPANRVTYLTVRGFTLKNNPTDQATGQILFTDGQAYLAEGLHIIEDCCFDGQNQVYDAACPMFVWGTCIDTVFRRNVFQDLRCNEDAMKQGGNRDLFAIALPSSAVVGQPQITIADNTFRGNRGTPFGCVGDAANRRYYKLLFERNTISANYSYSLLVSIWNCPLSNIVRNNVFSNNEGSSSARAVLTLNNASNTKVYHNTFFNNHVPREIIVNRNSAEGVEIKNNIFWPTPGSSGIEVTGGRPENLVCANNAFFTDFQKDGYPPGFGFSTTENTKIIGKWNGKLMTTDAWNKVSKNNTGNGYALEGPGLDKNMHLVAGSVCIDRGIAGLASDDADGKQRPVGAACDIGACEYGTAGTGKPLAGKPEPPLKGQPLAPGPALHLAAYRGDLTRIEACIQEGGGANQLDGRGYAPLHYAAQNNQRQALELLIAKGGDINVRDSRGQTPLYHASTAGNREVAELLISKGAEVNTTGKDGQTALQAAVANQQKDVAELLLSKGADLDAKDGKGYTPLYYAIWNEDQDMTKLLVTQGADVNYAPKEDSPPLHNAVYNEDVNTVKLLVDHGAKSEVKDYKGWTALRYAAWQGSRDILDVLASKETDASTLPLAACVGNLARVRSLVEEGAGIDAKDELGWTPLCWAVCAGRMEVAQFLIAKGADVRAAFEKGQTLLHVAARHGDKPVVELLLAKGADVNAKMPDDCTPLYLAVTWDHNDLVEFLITKGADVNAGPKSGQTPLRWARMYDRPKTVKLLEKYGAKR